jgi:hypothetical protein
MNIDERRFFWTSMFKNGNKLILSPFVIPAKAGIQPLVR